jgi:hypothetical protein
MEENTFNNEMPAEDFIAPEVTVEAPWAEEPVVEAPMPETKVEEVAAENNIEASIVEAVETNDAITTSDFGKSASEEIQGIGSVSNGVIGVTKAPRTYKKSAPAPAKKQEKTVAVYSTKNVSWSGVGKVQRGYNIVTPEQAEQWATRDHIRIATPEEVAREFGR